jgi:copper homeostasis protein
MRPLLEVIVQSLIDAREAARGGADRLEVVRALHDGGLTPPLGLIHEIAAKVSLPLRVMVRENAGYSTDDRERRTLRRAASAFADAGVDGLVMGFAHAGEPQLDDLADVLQAAPDINVTFHRAFDQLRDPLGVIDRLATVARVDRILTSGGQGTPAARCDRLRACAARAGRRLTIIAGGGVDDEMLAEIVRTGSVTEVHVGRGVRQGADPGGPVSAARVERLRERLGRHP